MTVGKSSTDWPNRRETGWGLGGWWAGRAPPRGGEGGEGLGGDVAGRVADGVGGLGPELDRLVRS